MRAAWMAVSAVSRSRISPTMTTSGSWRRMERRPLAKVYSLEWFIWLWLRPSTLYSIGSSRVMILVPATFSLERIAYSVVVFPDPVGPVVMIMPCGFENSFSRRLKDASRNPRSEKSKEIESGLRIRMTTDSPQAVGRVEVRTSIFLPSALMVNRPSCGLSRMFILRPATSLMRLIIFFHSSLLMVVIS